MPGQPFLLKQCLSFAAGALILFASIGTGHGQITGVGERLFAGEVQSVLEARCLSCHKGKAAQAGLDLSTREGILRGGQRGPVVVPGNAKSSLLYQVVNHDATPNMPPGGKSAQLPPDLIAVIASWIDAGAPSPVSTTTTSDAPELEIFSRQIRPVLESRCVGCHGANGVKRGGLDLTTREAMMRGGDGGAVVVSGKSAESLLIKHIKHELQPGMPFQGEKLPNELIAQFSAWVDAGAPFAEGALRFTRDASAMEKPRAPHWAFVAPKLPPIPAVKSSAWVRNPIDAFIAAEHEKAGVTPAREADKRTLLRRVYVDLIGLPPTPDEMDAFLNDRSSKAYEKVVDRLLADPRYGERWGRHWMDIWRYSDPEGYGGRVDYSQRHIWQWRDWIIESLNHDKPYDRMVMEMLAGDEIAPADAGTLRATGYLARSWFRFNRHSWLQDAVDHTATAFLGITLRCARCHEHKYDPFQHEEYYRFRAFFEPYDVRLDPVPGEPDNRKKGLPRVYEADPRDAAPDPDNAGVPLPAIFGSTHRLIRGDEANPDDAALTPGVPKILGGAITVKSVSLPVVAAFPAIQPFAQDDLLRAAQADIQKAEGNLNRAERLLTYAKARADGAESAGSVGNTQNSGSAVSFEKEIKPIFSKRCLSCHNAQTNRSGLSLETPESVLAGGNRNGPAVIPRSSQVSPLLLYLRGEKSPRMPMSGDALSDEQLQLITRWIDQLPQDDPATGLRKAKNAVAVAEAELAAARASLPALQARIAADRAKFQPMGGVDARPLAESARRAERQAQVLKAEASLLLAQQKLSEALAGTAPVDERSDKEREKKIAAARGELDAAQKALGSSIESYTHIGVVYPAKSSGRRTALAEWIVDPANPLTARVAVNHLWLRHFGRGIVPTVDNFGSSGMPPTNPQLLDWLAMTMMQGNWSMKPLHRLMVTSATYRMSSVPPPGHVSAAKDPENRLWWRMNSRRMEAEVVRDSVLYVSGRLDSKIGGPDEQDVNSPRRGMYFRQTAYGQTEFLRVFDAANPAECYQRSASIMPQQALALTNSTVSLASARVLALKLYGQHPENQAFIQAAFEVVLGRPASAEEAARAALFLSDQAKLLGQGEKLTVIGIDTEGQPRPATDPLMRAKENLVHVLFNHNDFLTIR